MAGGSDTGQSNTGHFHHRRKVYWTALALPLGCSTTAGRFPGLFYNFYKTDVCAMLYASLKMKSLSSPFPFPKPISVPNPHFYCHDRSFINSDSQNPNLFPDYLGTGEGVKSLQNNPARERGWLLAQQAFNTPLFPLSK